MRTAKEMYVYFNISFSISLHTICNSEMELDESENGF